MNGDRPRGGHTPDHMDLKIVTPTATVVEAVTSKISAETTDGWRTLLPRHIDAVATIAPGLLSYVADDVERLVAVDGGVLVKRGRRVRVATGEAVAGDDIRSLQRALRSSFADTRESERRARTAIAHLETDAIRRLMELEDHD